MKPRVVLLVLGLLAVAAVWAAAAPYERGVLALYKSSEGQTEKENEIFFYLSLPLKELGLGVRWWDIDRGLPDAKAMQGVRAIVSWFRGPAMEDPEAYLAFLERSMDSGVKVVALDNFGAYQNRRTQAFLEAARINLTLGRLGLLYLGDWTEDPALIQVAEKDPAMVEAEGPQKPEVSRFFYRFLPHDHSLQVWLSLRRKDRGYPASPVIVTNDSGGFALSRYIYRVEGGKVKMLLNVKAFLTEALFPGPAEERVALLADPMDFTTTQTLRYACEVLERAKLPCEVILKEDLPKLLPGDLRRFTAVGLVLTNDAGLDPAVLDGYLKGGGGLVSLVGGSFTRLAPALAMGMVGAKQKDKKGYKFRFGFLLGEGLSLEEGTFEWSPGLNPPEAGVELLASSYGGESPLLWSAARGAGRLMVWNWDGFETGDFQGFLLESFLYVRPVGVAATAGIGVFFIDDWPLPMYNVVKPPLSITDTEFYSKVWWPDIKALLAGYGIPYSSYLIFNYNAKTSPPFTGGEFFVAEAQQPLALAREILAGGQELALHGYNHVSLTREKTAMNYAAFPSQEAMEQSLEMARQEWVRLFGEHTLPYSYVAVNNIISAEGIAALRKVFPSVRVLALLRSGMGEETHTAFGPHPQFPDLYCIPRTTSGYPFTAPIRQLVTSAVAGEGVWTHYVHPDDAYDPARSQGLGWEELKRDLGRTLEYARRHYPWVRFVTLRQAHQALERLDSIGAEFRWQGERLTIRAAAGLPVRVRLNGYTVKAMEGLKLLYKYERMNALVLETEGAMSTLLVEKQR